MSAESNGVIDVLKKDGYDWDAYNDLKDPKYLGTLENKDWSKGIFLFVKCVYEQ
jgi:hypothetical protein